MDQFLRDKDRDTILVVHELGAKVLIDFQRAIDELSKILDRKIKVLVVVDKRDKKAIKAKYPASYDVIKVNTSSVIQLEKALKPYQDKLLTAVCRGDKNIPYFEEIIPFIPYLATPTQESLIWSTNKILMRRRLRSYNKRLSPAYTVVTDSSKEAIDKIEKKVGYPVVVKPAGLGASVLVSVCYHREELTKTLRVSLRRVKSIYKKRGYVTEPKILVEQFMEGEMYSTDVYVNSRGTMYTTPLVYVQTNFKLGGDDFYGYRQMTPVMMKSYKHQVAFDVAKDAVMALGLRNITSHVELMKTPSGWKVIELGPRVGGFRDFLYGQSYGINHSLNDLLIRLPMRPIIPRKHNGYSVVMKFYAGEEGTLESIKGINKIKDIESYKRHDQKVHKGEKAIFSRNGGAGVMDVYMFNKKRSSLLADIRRLEQSLEFIVQRTPKSVGLIPKGLVNAANTLGLPLE